GRVLPRSAPIAIPCEWPRASTSRPWAWRPATLSAANAQPTGSPSSGLLQMQPPLHGARLPPPLHAPPVHASHANRASAWSSPESSFKQTRRSASLCESQIFDSSRVDYALDEATRTPDDSTGSARAKRRQPGTDEDLAKASQNPIASLTTL